AATYAPKLSRADELLTTDLDPHAFARKVRALAPAPGARLDLARGALQIMAASPGPDGAPGGTPRAGTVVRLDREWGLLLALRAGAVWLTRVRASGRKEMGGFDYANGARLQPGALLVPEARP